MLKAVSVPSSPHNFVVLETKAHLGPNLGLGSTSPFTLGGHNFLISNVFLTILSVLDAPIVGLQVCFAYQKQQSLALAGIIYYSSCI